MSKSARRCGTPRVRTTFGRSDVVSRGRRKGLWTLSKVSKNSKVWGFCSISKKDGRRGTFEEDLQRCIFRVQETSSSELFGGPGADFLRRVTFWSLRSSGLLRWFCVTGAALHMTWQYLASLFRGRRNTLDRWTGKMAKRIGTRPSALHSTFHFWRKSRRILSFLMLSTLKMKKSRRIALFLTVSSSNIEEVSQNCCVFDVVNFSAEVSQNCFVFYVVKFKHWGSLADLLRFWCCQLWKMKKSRRIAWFWSLQIDR